MWKQVRNCSSSSARPRTPVKKQCTWLNMTPDTKWCSREDLWSWASWWSNCQSYMHKTSEYDTGCGYDGVGKIHDPELHKRIISRLWRWDWRACELATTFPSFSLRFNGRVVQESEDSPRCQNSVEFVSAVACVSSPFPSFDLCDCTLSSTVSQLHTLPRVQGTTASTDSFSRGHDPFTHACKARPLTDVGWPSLTVSLWLSLPLLCEPCGQ